MWKLRCREHRKLPRLYLVSERAGLRERQPEPETHTLDPRPQFLEPMKCSTVVVLSPLGPLLDIFVFYFIRNYMGDAATLEQCENVLCDFSVSARLLNILQYQFLIVFQMLDPDPVTSVPVFLFWSENQNCINYIINEAELMFQLHRSRQFVYFSSRLPHLFSQIQKYSHNIIL